MKSDKVEEVLVAKVHEQCIIVCEAVILCIQMQLWQRTAAAADVAPLACYCGGGGSKKCAACVLLFSGTWPCLRRISDVVVLMSCS